MTLNGSTVEFLSLRKAHETYVFVFPWNRRADVFLTLGRWAANPELSFTWTDAAVLAQRIRATEAVRA